MVSPQVDDENQNSLPIAVAVMDLPPSENPKFRTTLPGHNENHEPSPSAPLLPGNTRSSSSPRSEANRPGVMSPPVGYTHALEPVVISRSPIVVVACPECSATNVRTQCRTVPGYITVILAVVLFVVCWPLFWIPFVMRTAKRTDHFCPHCRAVLYSVKPLQDCCVTYQT